MLGEGMRDKARNSVNRSSRALALCNLGPRLSATLVSSALQRLPTIASFHCLHKFAPASAVFLCPLAPALVISRLVPSFLTARATAEFLSSALIGWRFPSSARAAVWSTVIPDPFRALVL